MFQDRQITAIVPARGGSKGLPGKNLLKLGKFTLVERAILIARQCPQVDRVILSTDDPQMHALAGEHGAAAPALRPDVLASDTATSADVVRHLIDAADIGPGWLLLLQPTSPLRTLADLAGVLALAGKSKARSVVSVVAHEEPRPEKLLKLCDGDLEPYLGTLHEGPRQALPMPYALNGAFYLIDRDLFLETGSFLPAGTKGFVMPDARSANIDAPRDWDILNAMVKAGKWTFEEYD
ncbi:MAG: acylneuraminate cytidylyltransferase family protein [Rhizobiales bacterium]|nr:acylneuraminate cytidylyltransferase family protein [Hyphomicrobiales bacterium]